MHLKVDAILFQNIFQQRPGQRHFEWLDASWCFSSFLIWSSRDLFCDMLCVFTQLHKPAHIVEMDATKNVFAIGRVYGIMVYHITGISPENITCWLHCWPFQRPQFLLPNETMILAAPIRFTQDWTSWTPKVTLIIYIYIHLPPTTVGDPVRNLISSQKDGF